VVSWLDDFLAWAAHDSRFNTTCLNEDGFFSDSNQFYDALGYFLADVSYSHHYQNLRFNDDGEISTSRIGLWHKKVGTTEEKVAAMLELREECERTNLSPKPFPYTFAYVFIEQFVIIYWELVLNLVLSLAACAVVSLFVLHHPGVVVLLIVIVSLIDVDLLGSIYFWGLDINSITTIDLVMAVGLVVDYVAHIMHFYLHQDPALTNRDTRVINAMAEVGPSVLSGCLTTFIGILPLMFAKSEIFRVFFKMFFNIIVYATVHGLVLTPVLLSVVPLTPPVVLLADEPEKDAKAVESAQSSESGL